jgi:hypothetical protein
MVSVFPQELCQAVPGARQRLWWLQPSLGSTTRNLPSLTEFRALPQFFGSVYSVVWN